MVDATRSDLTDLLQRVRAVADSVDPAADERAWLGARFDAGLAWVHFPDGLGGSGLSRDWQTLVDAEFAAISAAAAPANGARNPIGLGMGAPTIAAHGTAEQQARLLRPLWTGEEIWCQLFSEPGAGSDLAGLCHPSRARRRRLADQRAEGVDQLCPQSSLGNAARSHRPGRPQARRADLLLPRHALPRRRGPAAAPGHRTGRIQ